jgi:hypothetical protein
VEEWRAKEKGRRLHREALRVMEEEQKIVKMERKQRAIEMVAQRRHESRQRHEYIERQLV